MKIQYKTYILQEAYELGKWAIYEAVGLVTRGQRLAEAAPASYSSSTCLLPPMYTTIPLPQPIFGASQAGC